MTSECKFPEKQAYESLSKAERAAARMRRQTGERVTAYECSGSRRHYHTGHAEPVGARR